MQNEMYDFDLNGNRKTAKIQDKNESYKTGEYNRLLSDENYRYEYDQEGNRISKTNKDNTTTKYFWDHRNRLTKVQTPTESIDYIYDYQNRLVKRTQDKSETHFVHDDWQIILQFENKEIKPTHRYLWGTKQDELICDNENWTLTDHLNTIRDIVKSDGTVISHLEYNAFGKLISETKNDLPFFAYTGKLFDNISNLQWNINRWYDSDVNKWISEDSIGFNACDVNLYRYVFNKSNFAVDYNGLSVTSIAFEVAGRALTILTLSSLATQSVGLNASSSFRIGEEYFFDYLIRTVNLDQSLERNRNNLRRMKKCAKNHIVRWELSVYESDFGSSSLRDSYALTKEEQFYSFDEKDVKGKTSNRTSSAYHLAIKCSEGTFSTCFSVAIDPKVPNQSPLYAGEKMCDFGFSVNVRIKFAVYLESYDGVKKVETIVDNDDVLLGNFSCHSNLPE